MEALRVFDFVIIVFLIVSISPFSIVGVKKTLAHGYYGSLFAKIDKKDKRLLKTSGILFLISMVLIGVRLCFWGAGY